MKPDPAFATSPICVTDKDYEFSVNPEIITLVESDPFYGLESETVVAHLTKLNDIATLFTNDEKSRYYYILKIFPLRRLVSYERRNILQRSNKSYPGDYAHNQEQEN